MSSQPSAAASSLERNPLGYDVYSVEQGARYDLLLKGGHVIDPANGTSDTLDVAVAGGHIACVTQHIPIEQAKKVVNVEGLRLRVRKA